MAFATGEPCMVACGNRTVEGKVVIISDNQMSAFIKFDAMLAGHVGEMPIAAFTPAEAALGRYHSIIDGTEVRLSRKAADERAVILAWVQQNETGRPFWLVDLFRHLIDKGISEDAASDAIQSFIDEAVETREALAANR
jgi:hypothetical protein